MPEKSNKTIQEIVLKYKELHASEIAKSLNRLKALKKMALETARAMSVLHRPPPRHMPGRAAEYARYTGLRTGARKGAGDPLDPTAQVTGSGMARTEVLRQEARAVRKAARAGRLHEQSLKRQARAASIANFSIQKLTTSLKIFTFTGLKQAFIQVRSLTTSLMVFVGIAVGAAYALKQIADAAFMADSAIEGLKAVVNATGRDWNKVNAVLKKVVDSGFMNVADASASLRNLLLIQKLSTEEAEAALWNLVAAAMGNTKAQYPLAEQVKKTTEGLRDLRSQASDAVGVGKNLDIMIREWAEAHNISTAAMSHEQKQYAATIGFMKETEKFLPLLTSKKLENVRASMQLQAAWMQLKITLGQYLMPLIQGVITEVKNFLMPLSELTKRSQEANKNALKPIVERVRALIKAFLYWTVAIIKLIPRLWSIAVLVLKIWFAIMVLTKITVIIIGLFKLFAKGALVAAIAQGVLTGNILQSVVALAALAGLAIVYGTISKEVNKLQQEMKAVTKEGKAMQNSLGEMGLQKRTATATRSLAPTHAPGMQVSMQNNFDVDVEEPIRRQFAEFSDTVGKQLLVISHSGQHQNALYDNASRIA